MRFQMRETARKLARWPHTNPTQMSAQRQITYLSLPRGRIVLVELVPHQA